MNMSTSATTLQQPGEKENFINQRLYSLDALRGFDMFWIIGAEEVFHALAKATGSPFWERSDHIHETHSRKDG